MTKVILALALVSSSFAMADQCAWNDKKTAARGAALIRKLGGINHEAPSIYTQCEPCNETKLERVKVKVLKNEFGLDVHFRQAVMGDVKQPTFWEVNVTTAAGTVEKVDLAYVFVKTAKGVYTNVAQAIGCPVSGVSGFLHQEGVE